MVSLIVLFARASNIHTNPLQYPAANKGEVG